MKRLAISSLIIASVILIAGCEKDNFKAPDSFLTGTVVYSGNPVGVRSSGTELELWQYGFALRQKIAVYIAQDGTYSARLFAGDYKLVRKAGGPWVSQTDSIDVKVSGNTNLDVPVTPYFIITGETFTYTKTDSIMTSICSVTKVGTLNISSLTLYVGITNLVDANNNILTKVISSSGLTDLTTAKTNTVKITNIAPTYYASRKYVYVRLGVATSGVGERLYTPIQKITLN